jgi:sugar lactone lactonase YvrE
MSRTIERVGDTLSQLGEGPVWDDRNASVLWVDIIRGHVHRWKPAEATYSRIDLGEMVGVVAMRENGQLIAGIRSGIALVDALTGTITRKHAPESHLPENRFNDGKCDPGGRFWAGTMPLSGNRPDGSLYLIGIDGSLHRMLTGVTISNGLAWSHDLKRMYYIDTPTFEVACFDYDNATGSIDRRRTAFKIPRSEGAPDGMTIDAEGMLWVAHWGGWQVTRWDPEKGVMIDRIKLPVSNVTSCTFGGPDFRDLYITSAREGLSAAQLEQQPLAGSLFVVKNSDWKGVKAHRYAGTTQE